MCILRRFTVKDADIERTVAYTRRTVRKVLSPLSDEIVAGARESRERTGRERYLLALAGPPGCGKSTLAALLGGLLDGSGERTVVLPLDGFHLKNEELKRRRIGTGSGELSLYERKGAKESYDVERLFRFLGGLRKGVQVVWPVYSRTLHEPVDDGVRVPEGNCICIVEGNYLLLNVEPWSRLREFFDMRILVLGKLPLMRRRILARKARGGFTRKEAKAHFLRSDALNIAEVIERSGGHDLLLSQRGRHGLALSRAECGRR